MLHKSVGLGPLSALMIAALTGSAASQDFLGAARQEFVTTCAACHNLNGNGDGILARLMTVKPADLTTLAKRNGGDFPLYRVVEAIDGRNRVDAHGDSSMPVWGDRYKVESDAPPGSYRSNALVRSRILELVVYLQSIQVK